jgi:hypothetical protein
VGERKGVIPPRPGRPPQRPDSRQVTRRRLLALGVLLLLLGGLGWLAVAAIGGGTDKNTAAPTTSSSTLVYRTVTRTTATGTVETVIAMAKPFHIVFPEGFTRRDMAERVAAVAKIAQRKRHVRPRLARRTYLAATRTPRVPSCFKGKVLDEGGFPLSCDLRVLHPDHVLAARARAGRRVLPELGEARPRVRPQAKPDAV